MNASSDASHEVPQQDVVEKIHRIPGGQTGGPTLEEPGTVRDMLFAANLLKEEGEVVRVRVVIAPPEGFPPVGGPPEGIHAVRFTGPRWLNLVGGGRKPMGDDSNITAFLHHHRNR